MKIGILTFVKLQDYYLNSNKKEYLERERLLKEAAEKKGYLAKILIAEKCQLYFTDDRKSKVFYHNKRLFDYDVIIPVIRGLSDVVIEAAVLKQFEFMGVPVMNNYYSAIKAKNKLRTLQVMVNYNIPVPKTMVVRRFEYVDNAVKKIGGYPVIIKTPYGSLGAGVAIVESRRALISALDILWAKPEHNVLLIQEYIAEAEGKDLRVFVVGDKVVATMERTAAQGEFRSNLDLGGHGASIKISKKEERIALQAVAALRLQWAGVDILRSKRGPVIMEVNCNPGFGIIKLTGIDTAGAIIDYAVTFAKQKNVFKEKNILV